MSPTAVETNRSAIFTSLEPQTADLPIVFPGPQINNAPTNISLLSDVQLRQYPYLRQLRLLINAAFASTHTKNNMFRTDMERLQTDMQLIGELGPEWFTYIISSTPSEECVGPPTLHAGGSARRLLPKDYTDIPEELQLFKRSDLGALKDVEAWELKLLAVDPSLHRQGLASMLIELLEQEIQKRSIETRLNESTMQARNNTADGEVLAINSKPKEVRFILDTVKEINEGFYLRRGFATTEELVFPPGTFGNPSGFTSVFMEKILSPIEGARNGTKLEMTDGFGK